jgi:curved DNA-binding protein CbpA
MEDGEDPYEVLGVDVDSVDVFALTERDIARYYRKQALRWHPDKNPDDEAAATMLARVFLAYEILSNEERRKEYHNSLRARVQRREELELLNEDRRRMRLDLELRERKATSRTPQALSEDLEEKLRKEIDRLRREHGLRGELSRPSKGPHAKPPTTGDDDLASSPWAAVPGFEQWYAAKIDFEDLEKAVLARARSDVGGRGPG